MLIVAGDAAVTNRNFDESDTAYKVFGRYSIGFIPLVDFAVEASYVHFDNPNVGVYDVQVKSLNAFGLTGLSFGPFGIFAKVGVIDCDVNTNNGIVTNAESGTDPAYGARLAIGSFSIRAEYECHDLDSDVDVEMVSVSGLYTF